MTKPRRQDQAQPTATQAPDIARPATTEDEEVRAWAERVLEKDMLGVVEETLSKFELDPALTEQEVLLAAAPLREAMYSKAVALVTPLIALALATVSILLTTSDLKGFLVVTVVVVAIFVFRALTRVHLVAVEKIIEHRSDQGTLLRESGKDKPSGQQPGGRLRRLLRSIP